MGKLDGKAIAITGASRGLGEAMAVAFAREGAVLTLGARTAADLERVALRCREAGATVRTVVCDVTSEADVQALVDTACAPTGRLDVFVNNAGVGVATITPEQFADVPSHPVAVFEQVLRTNLVGQFIGLRAALPRMAEGGSLINVGSETARQASPGNGVYAASKAGIDSLTKTLAVEQAKRGVRVNALSPGKMVDTQLFGPAGMPDFIKQRYAPMAADGIGPAAVWLASDDSRDVTGTFVSAFLFNEGGSAGVRERAAAGDKGWG